jgi:hypothetical protein
MLYRTGLVACAMTLKPRFRQISKAADLVVEQE